ncbi:MAG: hypothetical protein MCM46_03615 [Candidatus Manganitrophus sp. SB1]|nr:hypothetical protein [Candidatus Manganitrophus morganii]
MSKQSRYRFRKIDNIGAADAQEDEQFLKTCFIDTGDLQMLRDCSDPHHFVMGRTGSGKTALLRQLKEVEGRVIEVQPQSLALAYISNSSILNFLSQLGVKLDIFFRLLWRHIFTVEILKYHFNIRNEADKISFVEKIKNLFRDKQHTQALEYLENWGKMFWEETEYRIKELTSKLETDLSASILTKIPGITFTNEGLQRLTEEEKQEVIQRAQHVVNQVQIRQLSDVIDLVNKVITDSQKRYYIVIDRLDENWIEDSLRYRLVRALIETVRDFRKVEQAKIIVALRYDLLDRVFRITRDAGFQEEKYESMYLNLRWTKEQLINVLDTRIDFLIKQSYTLQKVTHKDILPKLIKGQPIIDYILDRTMMRPRDVILFFNYCIALATGSPEITTQMIKQSEGEYSRTRLRSLADEWYADYPQLIKFSSLLKNRRKVFSVTEIAEDEISDFCLTFVSDHLDEKDSLSIGAKKVVDCTLSPLDFRKEIIRIFYRVALVGLKLESYEVVSWSITGRPSISPAEINDKTRVSIHPCFWRTLGIQDN